MESLYSQGFIPSSGLFDISEDMLKAYVETYQDFSAGNQVYDTEYARKLAGIMLLKLKIFRGGNFKSCKEGIVYAVQNPAWANHVKIGITLDHKKRLAAYQTYDPFRAFHIAGYEFCLDRKAIEREVLHRFDLGLEAGEWIRINNFERIIKYVRELNGQLVQ